MRSVRHHAAGDLRLDTVPEPTGPGVMIDIAACGVCGSDLHFVDGTARTGVVPVTLGHEVAGVVASSDDDAWRAGDRVVVTLGSPCGVCARCREGRVNLCVRLDVIGIDRDGGLADRIVVDGSSLVAIPDGVSAEAAATAVDAGATAHHAVVRRAGVAEGRSVAVIGIGGLGSYGLQIARRLGAVPIIAVDTDLDALQRARELGADEIVPVEEGVSAGRTIKMLTDGGVDTAIEFVGSAATVDLAVKALRPGGIAVAVGVGLEPLTTIPPVLWSNNEYTLAGSYGSLPGDVETVLDGLAEGSLQPPPLTRIALDDAVSTIIAAAAGDRPPGRLVVVP